MTFYLCGEWILKHTEVERTKDAQQTVHNQSLEFFQSSEHEPHCTEAHIRKQRNLVFAFYY